MNGLALQHGGDLEHVVQGGIGAGADAYLIDLHVFQRLHGHHVVRAVGTGDHGFQGAQVNVDDLIVLRVRVAGQGNVVLFPALRGQKLSRDLVGGENGGGRAQLRTHVGDGAPLRDGQGGNALAAPLDDRAHAALDGEDAQQLQRYVFGGDVGSEPARQVHLVHFGHGDIIRAAAHGHRHVQSARAESQHTDAAAGGSMAVRTDEGLAGLAETLQMHLMADAVAGAGEIHAVLCGDGLQIAVVIAVLKAALEGVVIDVGDAHFRFHSGNTHGLEFQIGHGAGGVLRQGLVDAQRHLAAGGHVPGDQMGRNDFLCDCLTHDF